MSAVCDAAALSRATPDVTLDGRDAPMVDLNEELTQAWRRMGTDQWRATGRLLGSAKARFCRDPSCPRWEPVQEDEAGVEVLVLQVREHGTLVDLVAWREDRPKHWRLRTGHGQVVLLGHGNAGWQDAWWEGAPLVLHESPAAWLAAGAEGCCILDWRPEHVRAALSFIHTFNVATLELGERLDAALAIPQAYKITVAMGRRAA